MFFICLKKYCIHLQHCLTTHLYNGVQYRNIGLHSEKISNMNGRGREIAQPSILLVNNEPMAVDEPVCSATILRHSVVSASEGARKTETKREGGEGDGQREERKKGEGRTQKGCRASSACCRARTQNTNSCTSFVLSSC